MPKARDSDKGVLIEAHVTPGARAASVEYDGEVLRVRVKEPPDKGKANKAVLKAVSKILGACEIISGYSSRKKTLLVLGKRLADVESLRKGQH